MLTDKLIEKTTFMEINQLNSPRIYCQDLKVSSKYNRNIRLEHIKQSSIYLKKLSFESFSRLFTVVQVINLIEMQNDLKKESLENWP